MRKEFNEAVSGLFVSKYERPKSVLEDNQMVFLWHRRRYI
jgi:hypothetical protein